MEGESEDRQHEGGGDKRAISPTTKTLCGGQMKCLEKLRVTRQMEVDEVFQQPFNNFNMSIFFVSYFFSALQGL